MKHLDFTIDFETCALTANAAVMQVAIVPWRRDAQDDPFVLDDTYEATEEAASAWPEPYVAYVDLRSCVVEGMDFDPETISWWSRQSDDAKHAVCKGLAEPVADITVGALNYLREIIKQYRLDSICLWCQGMDVDIAILRSLCSRFDIDIEDIVPHTSFRDCRTVILEAAYIKRKKEIAKRNEEFLRSGKAVSEVEILDSGAVVPCPAVSPQEVLSGSRKAYDLFPPLPSRYDGCLHDANYDALRSTWYTWQALKTLQQ
jgi:hypothetical protein